MSDTSADPFEPLMLTKQAPQGWTPGSPLIGANPTPDIIPGASLANQSPKAQAAPAGVLAPEVASIFSPVAQPPSMTTQPAPNSPLAAPASSNADLEWVPDPAPAKAKPRAAKFAR